VPCCPKYSYCSATITETEPEQELVQHCIYRHDSENPSWSHHAPAPWDTPLSLRGVHEVGLSVTWSSKACSLAPLVSFQTLPQFSLVQSLGFGCSADMMLLGLHHVLINRWKALHAS
jgi:hypothetical protein